MLGSLLLDKDAMIKVADIVHPEDFYKDAHRIIFESMLSLYAKHEPIDLLSLGNKLGERNKLEEVSGRNPASLPPLTAPALTRGICSFIDRCPLRVDGVCNRLPPPRLMLDNGGSILCHRSEAELRSIQTPLRLVEGEVG